MPQYNNIPIEDRFALIHYVRILFQDYPKDSPEDIKVPRCSSILCHPGVKQPNQIPVDYGSKSINF